MKTRSADTHEFSLYWLDASQISASVSVGESFSIDDDSLYHRIVRVLRLGPGDILTLFDGRGYIRVKFVAASGKKTIGFILLEKGFHVPLLPVIHFFLPLLKRDALEQAMYSLVELGVTEIHLMQTQKVQRVWGGMKEMERLRTIMIAAAEQSKQYLVPIVYEPKSFTECVQLLEDPTHTFFFDPAGSAFLPIISSLHKEQPKHMYLMIGPEGDLTMQEKELLKERSTQFLRLTHTVLRAQQAVAVAMGIVRSMLF